MFNIISTKAKKKKTLTTNLFLFESCHVLRNVSMLMEADFFTGYYTDLTSAEWSVVDSLVVLIQLKASLQNRIKALN